MNLMSSKQDNSNLEVYANARLRRPSTKRAPVDALDARAADGVAAVHEGHGFCCSAAQRALGRLVAAARAVDDRSPDFVAQVLDTRVQLSERIQ